MTTKLIGIKKFRENITNIWKKAREENIRYVVLYHSKPILEVIPIDDEFILENLASDVAEARAQAKKGEVCSEEEVYSKLGF